MLKPEIALTGLCLYFDTNIIGDQAKAVQDLWRCRSEGWIRIQRTDTMDPELERASELKRQDLLAESAQLAESLGGVRIEVAAGVPEVTASAQSRRDLEDALQILHPGSTELPRRGNDVRDAMHICCAARYAAQIFVTRDKGVLKKSAQIWERFSLDVANPEVTLAEVKKYIDSTIRAHQQINRPKWIPQWTPQIVGHGIGISPTRGCPSRDKDGERESW